MNICIYGASSNRLDPVYYEAAEQLGRCIAASGDVLVFGGGADGLMGACARGAKARGGLRRRFLTSRASCSRTVTSSS